MPIDAKHRAARALLVTALGLASLGLAGCENEGGSASPQEENSPSQNDSETAKAEKHTEGQSEGQADEGPVDYTDPSEAESYCGAAEGLVTLSQEASGQEQQAAVAQMGERLGLFADAANKLAELAPDAESQNQWDDVGRAYSEAHSFYLSSGEQPANDHFLVLLADAVEAGTETFETQQGEVQEECDVDLSVLIPEE